MDQCYFFRNIFRDDFRELFEMVRCMSIWSLQLCLNLAYILQKMFFLLLEEFEDMSIRMIAMLELAILKKFLSSN